MVVAGVSRHGVATEALAIVSQDGDYVVVVGIDHAQFGRRATDTEVEVVIARIEPDLVSPADAGDDRVNLTVADFDGSGTVVAGAQEALVGTEGKTRRTVVAAAYRK